MAFNTKGWRKPAVKRTRVFSLLTYELSNMETKTHNSSFFCVYLPPFPATSPPPLTPLGSPVDPWEQRDAVPMESELA